VILIDANLLVYAYVSSLPQHKAASAWLDERLNGAAPVGLPWPSLLAFVRLVSNPRIFERPKPVAAAWKQVEEWLDCPPVWVPQPTERHREILSSILKSQGGRANLVPDAHLAALAIEHGLILCSTDGDFARIPHLRWENPLAPD
jgi:toxin-antitoxin system PIN domain toxin